MKPNSTLWDVLPTLKAPCIYVDRVLAKMNECVAVHGDAFLRLGTSPHGKGLYPCFRITYHVGAEEKIYGSYIDSGRPFSEPYDKVTPGDWSTAATGLHKVIAVRAKLDATA